MLQLTCYFTYNGIAHDILTFPWISCYEKVGELQHSYYVYFNASLPFANLYSLRVEQKNPCN